MRCAERSIVILDSFNQFLLVSMVVTNIMYTANVHTDILKCIPRCQFTSHLSNFSETKLKKKKRSEIIFRKIIDFF